MQLKHIITLIIILYCAIPLKAQQWITKKYDYDSTLNVIYGTSVDFNGDVDTLGMHIFSPICNDSLGISRRPLLMIIHGGAFLAGNKDDASIVNLCKQFAKRGYVTATIDYRLGFIADNNAWNCNYPNYNCVFATDSAEWYRAYYRAVQDAKGALRYLINRHVQYRIDTNNVFVAGESAGAFTALGVGLLDTIVEKLPPAYTIPDAPKPNTNSNSCIYNFGKTFPNNTIQRPDLGSIEGDIEPTTVKFTIKAIGNNYGGVVSDILKYQQTNSVKPGIYSFHQPCDLVVPFDSGAIYTGLSWCFTNGYNCYSIANTAKVYGSKSISTWNTNYNYGYNIQDDFTTTQFPYNFLFGTGSCLDQVNVPCHAYDNNVLRENNMAAFFANYITTNPVCDTNFISTLSSNINNEVNIKVYPNPFTQILKISIPEMVKPLPIVIMTLNGIKIYESILTKKENVIDWKNVANNSGIYVLKIETSNGPIYLRLIKH